MVSSLRLRIWCRSGFSILDDLVVGQGVIALSSDNHVVKDADGKKVGEFF